MPGHVLFGFLSSSFIPRPRDASPFSVPCLAFLVCACHPPPPVPRAPHRLGNDSSTRGGAARCGTMRKRRACPCVDLAREQSSSPFCSFLFRLPVLIGFFSACVCVCVYVYGGMCVCPLSSSPRSPSPVPPPPPFHTPLPATQRKRKTRVARTNTHTHKEEKDDR